jgi:hypothetical protein
VIGGVLVTVTVTSLLATRPARPRPRGKLDDA